LTCTGSFEGDQATVISQGAELDPQTSVNYNLGVTLTPTENLSASIDYWNYDYDDLIVQSESGQAILNSDCADDGIPNDPRIVRTGGGRLDSITTSFVNSGNVVTDGVDLALIYELNLDSIGDLRFDGRGTYVNKFEFTDGDDVIDGAGSRNFSNGFHTIPEWRWNAGATWFLGPHAINATVRYIDSYLNDQANNAKIDSMTTLDMQYSVQLGEIFGNGDTVLYVGVNNALDVDPPALRRNDSDGNLITQEDDPRSWIQRPGYDEYAGHDIRGRIIYAKAVYSF
jgi:iron complex outermembrane receptor protein